MISSVYSLFLDGKLFSFIKTFDVLIKSLMNMVLMYLLPRKTISKSVSPAGEQSITFRFLWSIKIAFTVSLWRTYACSICFLFPLCKESHVLSSSEVFLLGMQLLGLFSSCYSICSLYLLSAMLIIFIISNIRTVVFIFIVWLSPGFTRPVWS